MEGLCKVVPELQLRSQHCLFHTVYQAWEQVSRVQALKIRFKILDVVQAKRHRLQQYVLKLGNVISSEGEQ